MQLASSQAFDLNGQASGTARPRTCSDAIEWRCADRLHAAKQFALHQQRSLTRREMFPCRGSLIQLTSCLAQAIRRNGSRLATESDDPRDTKIVLLLPKNISDTHRY